MLLERPLTECKREMCRLVCWYWCITRPHFDRRPGSYQLSCMLLVQKLWVHLRHSSFNSCLSGGEGILHYVEKGWVCREESNIYGSWHCPWHRLNPRWHLCFLEESVEEGLRGSAIVDSMVDKATPVARCINDWKVLFAYLRRVLSRVLFELEFASHWAKKVSHSCQQRWFRREFHQSLCIESTNHLYIVAIFFIEQLFPVFWAWRVAYSTACPTKVFLWKLHLRHLIDFIACILRMLLNYESYILPSFRRTLLRVLHLSPPSCCARRMVNHAVPIVTPSTEATSIMPSRCW